MAGRESLNTIMFVYYSKYVIQSNIKLGTFFLWVTRDKFLPAWQRKSRNILYHFRHIHMKSHFRLLVCPTPTTTTALFWMQSICFCIKGDGQHLNAYQRLSFPINCSNDFSEGFRIETRRKSSKSMTARWEHFLNKRSWLNLLQFVSNFSHSTGVHKAVNCEIITWGYT